MNPVVVHTFYCSTCSYFSELSRENPDSYQMEQEFSTQSQIVNRNIGKSGFEGIPICRIADLVRGFGDCQKGVYRKVTYFPSPSTEINVENDFRISFEHACEAIQLCDNVKRVHRFAYQIFQNELESKECRLHAFVCGEEYGYIKRSFTWQECLSFQEH